MELFQKTEKEGMLFQFYEASSALPPKPDRNITVKEHYRPTILMNTEQFLIQQLKAINPDQVGFISRLQCWFDISKAFAE